MASMKMMIRTLFYRRESHGSKASQPGPPQRKPSTDNTERYFKFFFNIQDIAIYADDTILFNLAVHSF